MSDGRYRVTATAGALYGTPVRVRRRCRCDGHLNPDRHMIEVGDQAVWSALPPNSPDIGNDRWWHAVFCLDCAPAPRS